MSSVLKALKKLEDKDSQQPQIRTWAHIDTKKTVNRRVRWFWLFNKFLSILILLTTVGVIAGGWFIMIRDPLLVQKLSSTHVSKEKKTDSRPATAVAKTETGPVNSVNTAQEKGAGSEIPRKEAAGSLMYKESPEQGRKKTPVSVGKRGTEPVTFSVKKIQARICIKKNLSP